jgi:putative ABC transport system substrate-binding protein
LGEAILRRRDFITLVGGAATWPVTAQAQQPAMPVIGSLFGVSAAQWTERMAGLRRGLSELGYVEGRNVVIEYRWAEGAFDRLPELAVDLVERKVAVIFTGGSALAVKAAIAATQTIPIVFTTNIDPIAAGFVGSLNRPGRNATGISLIGSELASKMLELIHDAVPTATKIALLVNPNNSFTSQNDAVSAQAAARRLRLEIIVLSGGTESEIETAFVTAAQQRIAAVQVSTDAFLGSRSKQIATLALRHSLPTIYSTREAVMAGQLMSYGSNQVDEYRQAGTYVGRILKGERPADLPVVQPTKFELVVNLKTAKAHGLTIPESFLLRADEVIE